MMYKDILYILEKDMNVLCIYIYIYTFPNGYILLGSFQHVVFFILVNAL